MWVWLGWFKEETKSTQKSSQIISICHQLVYLIQLIITEIKQSKILLNENYVVSCW